jgi:hypothetical protein
MYNTNLTINYNDIDGDEGDTNYRKQLLDFLCLTMYDDTVSVKIDELYDLHKNKPSVQSIMPWIKTFIEQKIPLEISDNTRFLFLFSFDFFHCMYPIACSLINDATPTKEQINNFIQTIKSKIAVNTHSRQ